VLAKAVVCANNRLAKEGREQLPVKLMPHDLRRTFASLLFAGGEAPPYVMGQMGHTTANPRSRSMPAKWTAGTVSQSGPRPSVNGDDWTAMDSSTVAPVPGTTRATGRKPVKLGHQGP
jgi:hypothetical protein